MTFNVDEVGLRFASIYLDYLVAHGTFPNEAQFHMIKGAAKKAAAFIAPLTEPLSDNWQIYDHLSAAGYDNDLSSAMAGVVAGFEARRWDLPEPEWAKEH